MEGITNFATEHRDAVAVLEAFGISLGIFGAAFVLARIALMLDSQDNRRENRQHGFDDNDDGE